MHDDWKTKARGVVLVMGVVALASGPTLPLGVASAGVAPALVVNEIHADPDAAAGDANGDGTVQGTADEFVELVNAGAAALDVGGWTIADGVGTRHVFPAGSLLAAGCGVVVFGGGSPTGGFGAMLVQTASSGSLGLNNGGDTIVVSDAVGPVASYAYGSEGGDNQSLTRDPDVVGADPLVRHVTATGSGGARYSPGTRIDGSTFAGCAAEPTPTATLAATPVPTTTSTPAPTATASVTPTATPLAPTMTTTPTMTATPIASATPTPVATLTPLPTATGTPIATVTAAPTPSATATAVTSVTPTPEVTATAVASATPTPDGTATVVASATPTAAVTPTADVTVTATASVTPTAIVTPTPGPTATSGSPTTPTPEPTGVASLCLAQPRVGCRVSVRPGRSTLIVQDHPVDRRDRIVWKWRKGAATTVADFGDPLTADAYALCLYDESGPAPQLVAAAAVPANDACAGSGDQCWVRARAGARVLRYRRAARTPAGIERVVLRPGADGAARVTLRARGVHLEVPALPLPLPLRAQLQGAHGTCWESRHTALGARRNDARIYRGRDE